MDLKTIVMITMALSMAVTASAQDEPKLTVKPSGRILMDAAYINPQHQDDVLKSGVAIPDMRVGVGFTYGQWKGKIDMGYAYGKVNMKDVWLQYDFDDTNFVRGGYFIHQYGFQSSTSSSFKETMEEPQSNAVFNNDRTIGVMFEHSSSKLLATASVVVETDAMKQSTDVTGNEAIGAMARLLYRPRAERGNMLQVGISQVSGASRTSVGGYTESIRPSDTEQFDVSDKRTLDEVVNWLMDLGYLPSFCTACYSSGRTGDRFMDLCKTGQIQNCCQPNAIMTLKEFLVDYATQNTKTSGEKLIKEEIKAISNQKVKEAVENYLKRIENGERNFKF